MVSSSRLAHKGAIITGGGSGKKGDAAEWLKLTERDRGPKVLFQHTNVTSWDQLERLFDVFAKEFSGVPDIVVAGAGIYEASSAGFWNDQDEASHYKLLDINLVHPIKLTRIAFRRLRQARKPGIILHESSIAALKASPVLPLYAVSKAALSHFVRCMAPLGEMSGIKVVAVAPGVVDTPLFRDHPQALDHIDTENDFLLPQKEVVKAMLALAIDGKYPAGTVLEVNDIGGWREVQLLNDPGPQGHSKNPRAKASEAISLVKRALEEDAKGSAKGSKL
ncbi:hypothetical protein IL306_010943 [Fusarium sp. DS 682]|nr:hypothetical protein IL306_010943 [Fusarium sp. DS 682]